MTATATRENRWASANGGPTGQGKPGGKGKDAAPDDAPAKKGKGLFKSKKFIIAVVAVLALGGGAYSFLMPSKPTPPVGGDVVAMDATTLNLADGHYLKIAVAVQLVQGKASSTSFSTSHAAELVIDEFSNRPVTALSTNAARQKLTKDLLVKVQKAYPGEVFDVFVTQFVTQ